MERLTNAHSLTFSHIKQTQMVDVHPPRPLLPLPFRYSRSFESDTDPDWRHSYSHHDQDDWNQQYSERRDSRGVEEKRGGNPSSAVEYCRRPSLPYPSPLSLPRGREESMTAHSSTPLDGSFAAPNSSFDYKTDTSLARVVRQELAGARSQLSDSLVRRVSSKPASPVFQQSSNTHTGGGNSIVSYLQLPSTITTSHGSLSEFAAQVQLRTCTF